MYFIKQKSVKYSIQSCKNKLIVYNYTYGAEMVSTISEVYREQSVDRVIDHTPINGNYNYAFAA